MDVQEISYKYKRLPENGMFRLTLGYEGRSWSVDWFCYPEMTGRVKPPELRLVLKTMAARTSTVQLPYEDWLRDVELDDNDAARDLYNRELRKAASVRELFGVDIRELTSKYADA